MSEVIVITGLEKKRVVAGYPDEFCHIESFNRLGKDWVTPEFISETQLLPIHTVFKSESDGRNTRTDEAYIAYTKEVEDYLGAPFNFMKTRIKFLEGDIEFTKKLKSGMLCEIYFFN